MKAHIAEALSRLQKKSQGPYRAGKTFVESSERAVFATKTSDGVSVVIKVDTNRERLSHEALTLRACYEAGGAVPMVCDFDSRTPAILVISQISGTSLSAASPAELWRAVGAALARIHRVPVPAEIGTHTAYPGWDIYYAQLVKEWPAALQTIDTHLGEHGLDNVKPVIETALSSLPNVSPVLVHGDAQPEHFLCSNTTVNGVIDFGDSGAGDPAWDIAVLTLYCENRLGDLLSGYGPEPQLRSRIDRVIKGYWLVRVLGEVAWLGARKYPVERPLQRLSQLTR